MWLKICQLIQHVDDIISPLMLSAYFANLFTIIIRLRRALVPKKSLGEIIFFWESLMFYILRMFFLTHFGSNVHEESKKIVKLVQRTDSDMWTTETYIFNKNLLNGQPFLTGWKIFKIQRQILLGVSNDFFLYKAFEILCFTNLLNSYLCQKWHFRSIV